MTTAPVDMLGRQPLTPVSEARSLLLERLAAGVNGRELLPLPQSLDRILAADITATEDLPPAPRSTMDGYALMAEDSYGASSSMPCYLEVDGEIQMGCEPAPSVRRGHCLKIPTGGMIPQGADAVVMFEHTIRVDDKMIEVVRSVGSGENIIQQGEDVSRNQFVLRAGHRLRPQDLGLLAGLGIGRVEVFRPLNLGIFSTGDEIVPWQQTPSPGKIRDINAVTLGALGRRLGAQINDYGIVPDDYDAFTDVLRQAVSKNNLVLFSGGSSVGMRDLGEQVIEAMGDPGILVHGVRLKPGKPVIIGLHRQCPIFGLPGHPVSAMVCFELLVAPAITRLAGRLESDIDLEATVTATLTRNINSAAGRLDVIRVRLDRGDNGAMAEPVLGKSGAMTTLSRADGYFIIDEPLQGLRKGETVQVRLLQ